MGASVFKIIDSIALILSLKENTHLAIREGLKAW